MEVVRVIDWGNARLYDGDTEVMFELARESLLNYLGEVDLIVLGGYKVSILCDKFKAAYPNQKFVCMKVNYERVLDTKNLPDKIAVLGERSVLEYMRDELSTELGCSTLVLPDCAGWEDLIDRDVMNRDLLKSELAWDFELIKDWQGKQSQVKETSGKQGGIDCAGRGSVSGQHGDCSVRKTNKDLLLAVRKFEKLAQEAKKEEAEWVASRMPQGVSHENDSKMRVDVVILLSTHFWAIKSDLEDLFGWRVRVMDFRESLLRNVCLALKLRGVDGKRAKR